MVSSGRSGLEKSILLLVIIAPLLALPTAIALMWNTGVHLLSVGLLGAFWIVTGLGITVGYHRLFTHRSFTAMRPVKIVLACAGSMALEGPVATWVARHRKHHAHADKDGDPHSPLHGFWHAHVGFLLTETRPNIVRYAPDIADDPDLARIGRMFPVLALLSILLPGGIGYLLTGTVWDTFLCLLWGGVIRIGVVHHVTWSINSACHVWGTRRFDTPDHSKNNRICALLGGGEGWHNNHHAFPSSAWHSLGSGPDFSYAVIRALEKLRLASSVKVPTQARIHYKERQ